MAEQQPAKPALPEPEEMEAPAAKAIERPAPVSVRDKTSASLEAVLERVVGRKNEDASTLAAADRQPPREMRAQSRTRTRAEQELLDMIKAGMKG